LFNIYRAFASESESASLRDAFAAGISWADAKQALFERVDIEVAPMRETYESLINDPARIESILRAGALKARAIATPFMGELRHAVGLRALGAVATKAAPKAVKVATASFKQYREKDGKFYFKLVSANGEVLLQSLGFDSPKVAGQSIALLQQDGIAALATLEDQCEAITDAARESVADALMDLANAKA
jgi:tryptophanyl-tRNA synthetase